MSREPAARSQEESPDLPTLDGSLLLLASLGGAKRYWTCCRKALFLVWILATSSKMTAIFRVGWCRFGLANGAEERAQGKGCGGQGWNFALVLGFIIFLTPDSSPQVCISQLATIVGKPHGPGIGPYPSD